MPRRTEVLAAVAVAALLVSVLFAPLALILAVACHIVSRVSRWRPAWLAVPACCGAVWLLAIGPPAAAAAFGGAVGSAAALLPRLLTGPAALARLPAAQARGLAAQFPLALTLAAGAAAVAWWMVWLHTDEWDLPPARPGLASFCRRRLTAAAVRAGGVVTRDGVCLGADWATGRPAALSWREAGGGVLVTGAVQPAVLASGWQLTHAAIRRRKPVIVVDMAGIRDLPGMLAAVCTAAGAPLQVFGADGAVHYEPLQGPTGEQFVALRESPLGRWLGPGSAAAARISLAEVLRQRAVVLFSLDRGRYAHAAEVVANLVAADIAAVHPALGRTGAVAEGLCWFTECDGADPVALAGLVAPGGRPGLALVLTTVVPQAASTLAPHVNACVLHRLADRGLAGQLSCLTGTRLVPISRVPGQLAAGGEGGVPRLPGQLSLTLPAGTIWPAATMAPAGAMLPAGTALPAGAMLAGTALPEGTMLPVPVVSGDALCELGDDEFVLVIAIAGRGGATVLARCQAVAGRIPSWPDRWPDPPPRPGGRHQRGPA